MFELLALLSATIIGLALIAAAIVLVVGWLRGERLTLDLVCDTFLVFIASASAIVVFLWVAFTFAACGGSPLAPAPATVAPACIGLNGQPTGDPRCATPPAGCFPVFYDQGNGTARGEQLVCPTDRDYAAIVARCATAPRFNGACMLPVSQ